MNIGQLLEVHLGWAAKGIGKKIDDMVQQQKSVAELRKYLDKVYNKTGGKSDVNLDELNDAEIVNLAKNLTGGLPRSEEHTSELQSLMRISYAVFCLQKKTNLNTHHTH